MGKTKDDFKEELKLLKNPLINNGAIYKKLGMSRSEFHDKLQTAIYPKKTKTGKKFTDDDKKRITRILKKLAAQLQKIKC